MSLQPSEINPLIQRSFKLLITKIPGVAFFCNEVQLPTFSGEALTVNTPAGVEMKFANMNGKYGELDISFIIDSKLNNYRELKKWMDAVYDNYGERDKLLNIVNNKKYLEWSEFTSDATLVILDNQFDISNTIILFDMFPISLTGLSLSISEASNTDPITATASFAIRKYDIIVND